MIKFERSQFVRKEERLLIYSIYQSKSNKYRAIKFCVSSCKSDKAFYKESGQRLPVQEFNNLFPTAWSKYFLSKPNSPEYVSVLAVQPYKGIF